MKNSKRGMALSTAMAVCIVLAILVAALVSMASLNITTTQNAISQREAYITAKSALAFAESYYSQHDVPGKNDANGGSAVIFFKNSVVSNGGEIYVTKGAANAVSTATVDAKKQSKDYKVYVDVENTGTYFDLTANCKYNDGSIYRLSKEFSFAEGSEVQPNSFNGNVTYSPKTDARYLRIHVHTSSVFGQAPYVWTYRNTVNSSSGLGKSQIVNKLSKDSNYPSDTGGLKWDGNGISGNSSVFEGNGWYLTVLEFPADQTVNYVNAIVAKNGAARKDGVDAQSWEFFGLPVPKQAGIANGIDVYINLNRNCLRDYQNYKGDWGSGYYTYNSGTDNSYHDGLTTLFESEYSANIKEFAKYSGSWYTVSTRKYFVSTMHYRKQGVYDNSHAPGGTLPFTYEGYGWWRYMSYNPGDSIKGYRFDNDYTNLLSYNEYTGGEQIREGYVCEFNDGSVACYPTEAEANEAFANGINGQPGEGEKAGDYLSVYVRSSTQPVDAEVPTKISYFGTKREDSISPMAKTGDEELEFKKLADWGKRFAVIGAFNNWGRDPGADGTHYYDNLLSYEMHQDNSKFILEIPDLDAGTYPFKIIELKDTSGSIDEKRWDGQNGWAFAYPSENASGTIVSGGNSLKISFTWNGEYVSDINAEEISNSGPFDPTQHEYAVIGWLNNDGKSGGTRVGLSPYSESAYGGTDKMFYDESSQCYIYRTLPTRNTVVSGETYKFKIISTKDKEDNEVISGDGWNNSFGSDGKVDYGDGRSNDGSEVGTVKGTSASDYVFCPPTIDGAQATYILEIVFNPTARKISVNPQPTSLGNLKFYLIGDNNNWADGTQSFNKATSGIYEFESTGEVDSNGRFLYKYTTIEDMEPGDREVKVISSDCLAAGMTGDENNSIDFTKCWGEFGGTADYNFGRDGSGDGYKFTLTRPSKVQFVFAYDASNSVCCPISHTEVSGDDTKYVVVKFKNAKGKDSSNNDTEFVNKWDELYVTFTRGGTVKCSKVTLNSTVVNCNVPEDCEWFYFSNMPMGNDTDPNFQRTKSVTMKTSYVGKVFLPTKRDAAENNWWNVETEGSGVPDATEMSEQTANMVYVGSMQCNYYDAPIVKLLVKIVESDPTAEHASNGKYVFASYPYSGYDIKAGRGGTLNFRDGWKISYQGEVYYYIPGADLWGYSYLIVESSDGNDGGYLLENHMALTSGTFGKAASDKNYRNMDNRAGAVIVSDETYYDDSKCAINFDNYTPNWYTYKLPCASTVRISNITGVTSNSATFFSSTNKFSPSKINQYANAPLYISEDKEGYEGAGEQTVNRYYTYNPSIANVDTDEHGKVSVYFHNTGTAEERFSQVAIYAYNPMGDHDQVDDLPVDDTDGNPGDKYYRYSFDAGKYCYFIFFDPTTGSHETATKKTERLYLTGTEEVIVSGGMRINTHKCDILAVGNGADRFVPYIHPKTEAMYAFNTLDAAYRGCQIPSSYTYNGKTKSYKSNGTLEMALLKEMRDAASTYYKGSGPWVSSRSDDYTELAKTIQTFVTAIVNARTYIAEDVSTVTIDNYTGSRVFKEGSYRDDTFSYQERWVNALEAAYNNALTVYNGRNSNQTSVSALNGYIDQITRLIESPILDWNPNSVQIIVDDQVVKTGEDEDGNPQYGGGWGKANIHLYNCKDNGVEWKSAGFDLFDTTQSNEGFYAYAFKLEKLPSPNYMIAKTQPDENDKNYKTLTNGKRYIFHTATGKFDVDDSIMTYKVTYDKIEESNPTTTSYSWFTVRDEEDKFFAVQFLYDTTVKYSGGNYKIYAGVYNITASYPGFNTDIAGTRGINLFTDTAKTYFTDPKTYGMSNASSNTYSDWTDNYGGSNNIDIMVSSISKLPTVSARTSDTRKISFRYKNTRNNDLELKQKVELEAGTVSIAANKIDLSNYDFIIKAKTVIFLTDTTLVTKNNGTVVVRHGTYSFNKTEDEDRYTVSLQSTGENPDWREHFTLVSGTSSTLRRGRYITHE